MVGVLPVPPTEILPIIIRGIGYSFRERIKYLIFDTTQVTIANGLKARGAVRNSKAHLVGEAALEAAKSEASKRIEKVENMKDQYIKYANFLAQIMMKAINEKVQDRRPVSDAKDEVITIQKAAAALETLRSSNYHLYGLNDPDQINEEIPDMILTEMTADEIEEINRNFENIDGGNVKTSSMEIEDIEVELPFDEGDE